jgi:ribosomal protein S18 acetylase RimI-like enzyme
MRPLDQMGTFTELDNAVWHALKGPHAGLAVMDDGGLAGRYPPSVSPLAALAAPGPAAFSGLQAIVRAGEVVGLFTAGPLEVPPGWEIVRTQQIDQMVYVGPSSPVNATPMTLSEADVPDMLSLVDATKPGPFLQGTIAMGLYVGVRAPDGRLVAMAGQRLQLHSAIEISAVCTEPAHRGRGYALSLVSFLTARVLASGRVPFLHVKSDNAAKSVYAKAGFVVRRQVHVTAVSHV